MKTGSYLMTVGISTVYLTAVLFSGATCFASASIADDNLADAEQTMPMSANSETLSPIDPYAAHIVRQSAEFLAGLSIVSFSWFVTNDEITDAGETVTVIESGKTNMDRRVGFVEQTEQESGRRDYYYDGNVFTVIFPDEKLYASQPFTGDFDELVVRLRERTRAILPAWIILSEELPETIFEDLNAAAYLGSIMLKGREVHHIALSNTGADLQLWISVDESAPVPAMLIGTLTDQPGAPRFRVSFSSWAFNQEPEPEQFSFSPEPDFERIAMPSLSVAEEQAEESGK